jgi:hypothetical protein
MHVYSQENQEGKAWTKETKEDSQITGVFAVLFQFPKVTLPITVPGERA